MLCRRDLICSNGIGEMAGIVLFTYFVALIKLFILRIKDVHKCHVIYFSNNSGFLEDQNDLLNVKIH